MENSTTNPDEQLEEREVEATDSETLDDLQDAFGDEDNTPEDQEVPSPDGTENQRESLN